MNLSPADPFAGLEDDSAMHSSNPHHEMALRAEPKTFPCMSCHGTGKFQGVRRHQEQSQCFACGGKGHHAKPHQVAMQEKSDRKHKRRMGEFNAQADRLAKFDKAHDGLGTWMKAQGWSNMLADLSAQLGTPRGLTERQIDAAKGIRAKCEARKAEKAVAKAATSAEVDLSTIHAMFDKARNAGLNKLAYRAEGLVLSPARATSANAGGIYVKTVGGQYLGKVMGTKFLAGYDAKPEHKASLEVIARNPAEAAAAYGKKTGSCSCCGRELTDAKSIALGIGPICAEKWF